MKEFLLVLLGALISCGTTWFLDWLKFDREEKTYYRRKREETYLEMLENIDAVFNATISKHFQIENNIDTKKTTNSLRAKAKLYVKKQVADNYHSLMANLYEDNNGENGFTFTKWDRLVSDIRNDLNIKD